MGKIKWAAVLLLLTLLVYTRFVNISWGLPFPFHPDERNMATALQNLTCEIQNAKFEIQDCFNPHFFAYGQFPLFLGYFLIQLGHLDMGRWGHTVSFGEAVIALRIISVFASILTVWIGYKIIKIFTEKKVPDLILYALVLPLILSPALIQFSHFGTTESLLMFFYTLLIYLSILFTKNTLSEQRFLLLSSLIVGLAVATKISSLVFLTVPAFILGFQKTKILQRLSGLVKLLILAVFFSILFSPHNIISFQEFMGSMEYESGVALGTIPVFYTAQFFDTVPILFQFTKIFPFALGWPILILFLVGFFTLPYRWEYNVLRIGFLFYFLPTVFLYAKWTRFMAPIMPSMIVFACLTLLRLYELCMNIIEESARRKAQEGKLQWKAKNFLLFSCSFALYASTFALIVPGIAYLSIYQSPDVRITTSEWIYKNIPPDSQILSESGNVIDLPIQILESDLELPPYSTNSFNFYELDNDLKLQAQLDNEVQKADYIFVQSRRVFANYTCISDRQNSTTAVPKCKLLKQSYPKVNDYYEGLFSGKLGFEKVSEFQSYPQISFFGEKLIEFPDEYAEETWSIFDHPVVRIYKRKK